MVTNKERAYELVIEAGGSLTTKELADKLWGGNVKAAESTAYDLVADGKLVKSTNGTRQSRRWSLPNNNPPAASRAQLLSEIQERLDLLKRMDA